MFQGIVRISENFASGVGGILGAGVLFANSRSVYFDATSIVLSDNVVTSFGDGLVSSSAMFVEDCPDFQMSAPQTLVVANNSIWTNGTGIISGAGIHMNGCIAKISSDNLVIANNSIMATFERLRLTDPYLSTETFDPKHCRWLFFFKDAPSFSFWYFFSNSTYNAPINNMSGNLSDGSAGIQSSFFFSSFLSQRNIPIQCRAHGP